MILPTLFVYYNLIKISKIVDKRKPGGAAPGRRFSGT
jgi:hypothetical protein